MSEYRLTANVLHFAAAPTFAFMALLTGVHDGETELVCRAAQNAATLNGMALMYLLMSVFHLGPWLRLIGHYRSNKRSARLPVLF